MDLANYFNETVFDNAFPFDSGVAYIGENFVTEDEIELMIECYLSHYFKTYVKENLPIKYEEWLKEEKEKMKKEV